VIHVRRSGPVPPSLDGPGSPGATERARNEALRLAGREREMDFAAYGRRDVRDRLDALFHFKCAYCESKVEATQAGAVEHYRPKGMVTVRGANGKAQSKPGYPWLAAEWHNLLLSCTDCNSPRKQQVKSLPQRTLGKANWFPLADERRRATTPARVAREPRLLLDPCVDAPERHLRFTPEGDIQPRAVGGAPSAMGEATIETCGLARVGLMRARAAHKRGVLLAVRAIQRELAAGREPVPQDLDDLAAMLAPDAEYSAFARMLVQQELGPLLRRLGLR
jgi:uncharacterized protein (TIGR02646 family)